jgi:hypothetical protein
LDKLWTDSSNWRGGIIYICKDDPRLIVPKSPKWGGWTLNFAHASVWLLLVSVVFSILVPTVFFLLGPLGIIPGLLSEAAVIASWCVLSVALSSPQRYETAG